MKKTWATFCRLTCGAALMLILGGCSNDDSGPPLTDVTGAWSTTTWISAYVPGPNVSVTWNLVQNGSLIYGSFADNLDQRGTVEGSMSAYDVELMFTYTNYVNRSVDYYATVATNSSSMSGTFRGEGEINFGNANRLLTQ